MGHIYKRGRIYWVKYYRDGKSFRESSGSPKESDAKRLIRLREGDIARGIPVTPRMDRVKFDEMAEAVFDDYRINGRRSLKDVKMRFNRHLLPFFGGRRAASITTSDVQRFIVSRKEAGATNGEINRELAAFKRAYSLAIQQRRLMTKPHVPTLKENNVRKGFFEREQFESVRGYLPAELKQLVTFFYITGWRFSEVLNLHWSQVDFDASRVYLNAGETKNDDARVFPLTDALREVLRVQRVYTETVQRSQGRICPWVFHREGKQIKSFRRSWITACKKAGVPGRIPHDFRRTAVRNLVRAGVPEQVAMKMTGHKTRSVFERYNIVNDADLEKAARCLDAVEL